jgi:hypothetical protein
MQQDEKKVLNTLTAYGAGFQIKVLSSLLKHKEFLQTINDVISPEMFDNPSSQWIVSQILKCYYKYHATPSLDYLQIEVKKIDNEVLKVSIEEREPIARLFSTSGTSFYIDSMLFKLPLSDTYSAKVPVFTGFPSDKTILSELDSIILKQVKRLSMAIQKDSFHTAMIEQIDITPQLTFEFIPKIGNQLIQFGTATDIDAKLYKLKLFYKKVIAIESWNK